MACIVAVECFQIRRVRTEPIMYVGKRQPRFREGKGENCMLRTFRMSFCRLHPNERH
jgi:hypothetical protein